MALTSAPDEVSTRADDGRQLTHRVQAEYFDMPGLCITLSEAQRLWATDRQTCEIVLRELLSRRFLRITTNGRFIRA
jgi:hypothetical protein